MEFQQIAPRVDALLAHAAGLNLVHGKLTPHGLEMVYEGDGQRVEISLLPQIYPEGRVIMDAVNDLTIIVAVRRTALDGTGPAVEERIELPYSTWFGEDFM